METKFCIVKVGRFVHFVDVVAIYDTRKQANAEVKRRNNPRATYSYHVIGRQYGSQLL